MPFRNVLPVEAQFFPPPFCKKSASVEFGGATWTQLVHFAQLCLMFFLCQFKKKFCMGRGGCQQRP
eukprot:NODE_1722_length_500_cov_29.640798_g1644_i0.p1 GENE.NODE_1722_length_500_cov_29.640798_g1644_i0~~NODE_1722_length_500_cov_29.640798_g1644_i0.p1  ORF type:complete len:66 (-),score=9.97 NODE_1722_length_500_cov_29.640798_g1644_i0:82-279(-)